MSEMPNTPVFICSRPVTRQRGRALFSSLPSLLPAAALRRHGHHLGRWTSMDRTRKCPTTANGAIHPAGMANVNGKREWHRLGHILVPQTLETEVVEIGARYLSQGTKDRPGSLHGGMITLSSSFKRFTFSAVVTRSLKRKRIA